MRKMWIAAIACALIAGASVLPQTGFADYIANLYLTAAYEADTMIVDMETSLDSLNYYVGQLQTDIDSLRVLAESPEQRTTSSAPLLTDWVTADESGTKVTNATGIPVSGARAILLELEWTNNTDDFAFEPKFGISMTDTSFQAYGADHCDSISVDESDYAHDKFTYMVPLEGLASGYLFVSAYSGSEVDSLDITYFIVW